MWSERPRWVPTRKTLDLLGIVSLHRYEGVLCPKQRESRSLCAELPYKPRHSCFLQALPPWGQWRLRPTLWAGANHEMIPTNPGRGRVCGSFKTDDGRIVGVFGVASIDRDVRDCYNTMHSLHFDPFISINFCVPNQREKEMKYYITMHFSMIYDSNLCVWLSEIFYGETPLIEWLSLRLALRWCPDDVEWSWYSPVFTMWWWYSPYLSGIS